MADDSRKLSITYSSGLIPPPEHMSTLAVFYDEILLPNPFLLDIENIRRFGEQATLLSDEERQELERTLREFDLLSDEQRQSWQMILRGFNRLKTKWSIFYEQSLIQTIPLDSYNALKDIQILKNVIKKYTRPQYSIDSMEHTLRLLMDTGDSISNMTSEALAFYIVSPIILFFHIGFYNKSIPEIFFDDDFDTTTSRLSTLLTQKLFQYKVPQLQELNAEQILEVRDYLKDTKEGFTYYVNEMTDDVERRIQEHNLSDIEAVQRTFERKILSQYDEFRRQLAAKRTGFWAKVLAPGGKFWQVNAAPWTPAFWGAVLEMVGTAFAETAKVEEADLSNKAQAFHYLATLESEVSRRNL